MSLGSKCWGTAKAPSKSLAGAFQPDFLGKQQVSSRRQPLGAAPSQARPKEEGPRRPSGWLSQDVASLTLTSISEPGTVIAFVSASGILAAVQCQWDTFSRYCHATKTFASRSGSRQVGTISLKITSSLPISLDYIFC